jgi:hypothetical protein
VDAFVAQLMACATVAAAQRQACDTEAFADQAAILKSQQRVSEALGKITLASG